MLFDQNKLKIKSLQVGNPNKLSLEFNVHIQWYNHFDTNQTHTKWACLILNHTWHFRTINWGDRENLSSCLSVNESKKNTNFFEFNSFRVIWKGDYEETLKEPLNPYSVTFEYGIQHLKDKLQVRNRFRDGCDELVYFKCKFNGCKPELLSKMGNEDVLLHDIYKHLPHYPIIQVYWKIDYYFMVPYKRTIEIKRNIPKSVPIQDISISLNRKTNFNPLLYESDLHKLKHIQDIVNTK
ncbi:hypothetical protein RFI_01756, partial [Reticulomyxa filosa]